jgi:hypothetical protein
LTEAPEEAKNVRVHEQKTDGQVECPVAKTDRYCGNMSLLGKVTVHCIEIGHA